MTTKKLTQDEVEQITSVRDLYSKNTYDLGETEIQILNHSQILNDLKKEKEHLFKDYQSIVEKDKGLAKQLSDKYGQGQINIETGEIITSE